MKVLPFAIISLTLAACSSGGSNDNTSGANTLLSQAETGTSTANSSSSNTTSSNTASTVNNSTNSASVSSADSSAANTTGSSATTDTASSTTDSAATTDTASSTMDSAATTDTASSTTDSSAATQSETLSAEQVQQALSQTFASSSENLTGTLVSFNKDSVTASNPTSNEIETLQIDGKTLTLYTAEEKQNVDGSGSLKTVNGDGYKAVFGSYRAYTAGSGKVTLHADYQNMRYGTYTTDNGVTTLFIQGNIASSLPSRYVYTYEGNALYGKDGTYEQLASKATANFNAKTIKVELSEKDSDTAKLTFGGTIDSETKRFSGTDSEGIVTEGAFYGAYRDVGGIFYQTQGTEAGYNGVFGATGRVQSKDTSTTTATDY